MSSKFIVISEGKIVLRGDDKKVIIDKIKSFNTGNEFTIYNLGTTVKSFREWVINDESNEE